MGLREDAIAAAEEALEQRKTVARGVLASRLTPAEVAGLTVEATTPELVVFTDGTLHLAVCDKADPKTVRLVEPDGAGAWCRRGDVPDLPTLGALLATQTDA